MVQFAGPQTCWNPSFGRRPPLCSLPDALWAQKISQNAFGALRSTSCKEVIGIWICNAICSLNNNSVCFDFLFQNLLPDTTHAWDAALYYRGTAALYYSGSCDLGFSKLPRGTNCLLRSNTNWAPARHGYRIDNKKNIFVFRRSYSKKAVLFDRQRNR